MKLLNINRKFERMFPGIAAGEKAFERDLLSHGRTTADNLLKELSIQPIRHNEKSYELFSLILKQVKKHSFLQI